MTFSILSNGYDYPKPDRVRNKLEEILGQGILTSEGALSSLAWARWTIWD